MVPRFRSSHRIVLQAMANFGIGPLASGLAERCRLGELLARRRHVSALALEKVLDRPAQAGIVDVVRGIGRGRQVAARDLVLALGAGLDAEKLLLDRVLD